MKQFLNKRQKVKNKLMFVLEKFKLSLLFFFILSFLTYVEVKSQGVQQAGITVTGTVIDKTTKEPLIGVNIQVKGISAGTTTDVNGKFSVKVPFANASLVFSYVGYQPQEIALGGKTTVDVALLEDQKVLDEVVVVAYGTQKKETLTGSVATITTKDLQQSPTANLNNALAGRLPGLIATQYIGGEPGVDVSDVFIRGIGTYGDKSPIIIVDGVERDMRYLAADEIETFTILKDASATAAYGIRGANGVIVINTKRGKAQDKATVSFKASSGSMEQVKYPKYLGSADYAMLYNEAKINTGTDPNSTTELFSQQTIDNFRKAKGDNSDGLGYNWDYFNYAFKPGARQEYSLSIRGGNDKARYFIMANYYHETGNYKHTDLTKYDTQAVNIRYNFRANVDVNITKDFYTSLDLGARITDRTAPGTTADKVILMCNTQPPYLPITLPDNGNKENEAYLLNNPYGMLYGDAVHRFNILGELARTGFLNEKNTYVNGAFTLGHKLNFITDGLKAEGTFSYDAREGHWRNRVVSGYSVGYAAYGGYATFQPAGFANGMYYITQDPTYMGNYILGNRDLSTDNTLGNGYSVNNAWAKTYYQFKLNYDHKFDVNNVTAMVLFNRSNYSELNYVENRYQGISGRATYNYDSRYLAEFNIGYNGSENFAPGKRYGVFPAGALGWNVSNEKFMEKTKDWLNNLKLRGSFGLVGSDKISNAQSDRFAYLQFYGGGSGYNFGDPDFQNGGPAAQSEGNLANANLTWEKSRKMNIGLDASLWNGKLTIVFDYFREHRYDIITSLSGGDKLGFPAIVGKAAPFINSGIVDNHGVEFEIGWNGKVGKHFRYNIKPNFTFARNKIIFQNEIPRDYAWRASTGGRIGQHFVYVFDHFVNDQAEADRLNAMNDGNGYQPWGKLYPGDVVYKDISGNGRINDLEDRIPMGYPRIPEIQFGITITLQYKGLDFSMMFQGSANTSLLLTGSAIYDFAPYYQDQVGKVKPMHLNRWTEATKNTATYPRVTWGVNDNNKNPSSSLFLYDAKYIRLKNLEIGYSLPKQAIRFAGLQNVRIYFQGMNLLTFDGLKDVDVDPEQREQNDGIWYPIQRVLNIGIDITY